MTSTDAAQTVSNRFAELVANIKRIAGPPV